MFFNDTIAAISTPIGEGGIGIIRISGPKALEIGLDIIRRNNDQLFTDFEDHRVYHGYVVHPRQNRTLDEVLFFYAKAPRSFTTEDIIEIHAHGGMQVLSSILDLVIDSGARLAEPGEFTMRAFINGRIDLVQAESIIDLIRSKTDRAQELAVAQLTGTATREVHRIEAELYDLLIAIEAVLDFPEEGIPEITKVSILAKIKDLELELSRLAANVNEGRKIRDGITIVIIGRPNVGKSSLLNAFLQEERAIVTEIPGTTRDIIEANFQLRGIPFRLIDTAGIRETDNIIEKIGIEKAEQYLKNADLVLMVLDGSQPLTDADRESLVKVQNQPKIVVINKSDLPTKIDRTDLTNLQITRIIEVSALTRSGLLDLETAIVDLVGIGELTMDDRPLLSRVRHQRALEKALESIQTFANGLNIGLSEDLLAVDLRSALEAIGEITGKKVADEVIHGIFAQFCIGK